MKGLWVIEIGLASGNLFFGGDIVSSRGLKGRGNGLMGNGKLMLFWGVTNSFCGFCSILLIGVLQGFIGESASLSLRARSSRISTDFESGGVMFDCPAFENGGVVFLGR